MDKLDFRSTKPQRKFNKNFSKYQSYKQYLRDDFNKRCGYTDCADQWFGGITTFHIDHFQPLSKAPTLSSAYSNLVYSCSYVNILKTDDDAYKYLEPCIDDYNLHFYRNEFGEIFPKPDSAKAVYMHKKLKLGLARYGTIWLIERLFNCMEQLQIMADSMPSGNQQEKIIKELHFELSKEFTKYFKYLTN